MDTGRDAEKDSQVKSEVKDTPICNKMDVIEYSTEAYLTFELDMTESKQLKALSDIPNNTVRWMNIDGACSETSLTELGEAFGIHPLVRENIANRNQRAKVEEYPGILHIVAKMLYFVDGELTLSGITFMAGYLLAVGSFIFALMERKRVFSRIVTSFLKDEGKTGCIVDTAGAMMDC